eukprot:6188185-Pleurochrysis_carterae.AAC.5
MEGCAVVRGEDESGGSNTLRREEIKMKREREEASAEAGQRHANTGVRRWWAARRVGLGGR